ncbi:MAG TPA: hypothetical protein ENI07_20135 [Desulfobacterales bacterium]|nr:hypothetical protein [Desulfobacterales bacterium]
MRLQKGGKDGNEKKCWQDGARSVLAATSGANIRIPSSARESGITSHNACVEVYGSDEPSPKKSKKESVDK